MKFNVFDPKVVLKAFWSSFRPLCGVLGALGELLWDALGGLLGASREPRNHLGLLLGVLAVFLLGSSRLIFFVVVFHLSGLLRVDFGFPR